MSSLLTRMFASLTLSLYLVVGWVGVRVFAPEMTSFEISTAHLSLFSETKINSSKEETLEAPVMAFKDIQYSEKKSLITKRVKVAKELIIVKSAPVQFKYTLVDKNELPFSEPVVLAPVFKNDELVANYTSLFNEIKTEVVAEQKVIEDQVDTKMAAVSEPEFFEYPEEKTTTNKEVVITEENKITEVIKEVVKTEASSTPQQEEVQVEDLFAFDYSKAEHDLKEKTLPTVSMVTTQTEVSKKVLDAGTEKLPGLMTTPITSESKPGVTTQGNQIVSDFIKKPKLDNGVTIQVVGTDLKKTHDEVGFEVRPQDDLSESFFDYNNGDVHIETKLAGSKMTRSVAILKRGFAPTNTDMILEEGASEMTVPLIEEDTFNELIAPYESRGPIGSVLIELDNKTETATLDVPYSQVIKLNENMNIVQGDNFSYQLFVGVKAGNALLSYKTSNGETSSKIIHIHERELTFESNFYENVTNEKISLFEEDILSKEKMPLIISGDQVKQFATDKTAKKINDHTFVTEFNKIQLGSRKYIELNHLEEPIFVGFKENQNLDIPSENFIRNILSKSDKSGLGNRCVIQVNLTRKATRVDIGSESVGASLRTFQQMLDADGKFYDSLGAKSEKIIIVGENQANGTSILDSKINLKITYEDESVQYFGSYCSPNTYLVEQL
jgi:hypothetical protein